MKRRRMAGLSRRTVLALGGAAATSTFAAPFVLGGNQARADQALTVTCWGGSYREAVEKAFINPFTEETGIAVTVVDNADLAKVKAQVTTNNVQWDVFDGVSAQVTGGIREGLWEELDLSDVDSSDLVSPGGQYHIGFFISGSGVAWDEKRFSEGQHPIDFPSYWDVEKFPGRRGLQTVVSAPMEMALVADGVPARELYPLDIERAFASLDRIKPHIRKFIEQTPQTVTLLQSGDVDFNYTPINRVLAANRAGGTLKISLAQTVNQLEYYAVLKGTRNREAAMRYIAFSLRPDRQAALSEQLSLAPNSRKAVEMVSAEARQFMPDMNNQNNIMIDDIWWADNFVDLQQRYTDWMIS